jgi:hypothetical protein
VVLDVFRFGIENELTAFEHSEIGRFTLLHLSLGEPFRSQTMQRQELHGELLTKILIVQARSASELSRVQEPMRLEVAS